MGFAEGVAITVNGDLTKYVFEQQLTNLLRGAQTFSDLHVGAVDTLIAEFLRPKGYVTSTQLAAITNTNDFRPALCCWVVSRIFIGQAASARSEGERANALSKADFYRREYERLRAAVVIQDGKVRSRRGLPLVVNVDGGSMYGALGGATRGADGSARPTQTARGEIDGYDDLVIEGK